jgi:hypothetical protein
MKSAVKAVVLFTLSLALFAPVLAIAQSLPGQFQHEIIVIQENRTPDNLFAGIPSPQPTMYPWFESGVDLAIAPQTPHNPQGGQQWCLGACFDPGHEPPAWHDEYVNGYPDLNTNACGLPSGGAGNYPVTYCSTVSANPSYIQPVCNSNFTGEAWIGCGQPNPIALPTWPEESYVSYTYDMAGTQHVRDTLRWAISSVRPTTRSPIR